MGNRAVITTPAQKVGVYLHWNGGRDGVEAFLKYCELKGYRNPAKDIYGWARLCQVIGNFFGGTCSVGIGTLEEVDYDNGDNGMYIIENWKIIGRKYNNGLEQTEFDLCEMVKEINSQQPEDERLPEKEIDKALGKTDKTFKVLFEDITINAKTREEVMNKIQHFVPPEIAIVAINEV